MASYLTDSWSTISGLASVAYGSPTRYPEVANQVRAQVATSLLGTSPPSEIISNRLNLESVVSALQAEYEFGEEFSRYVDGGSRTIEEIAEEVYRDILQAYNETSTYESSLTDILEYIGLPANLQRIKDYLTNNVPDLELFSRLASNVSYNKPDKLPAGSRFEIKDNVPLDSDQNGISFPTGYLTPDQYFNNVAYPGAGDTAQNLPNSFVTSLIEGYKGYATLQPLDDLLRPGIASLISGSDIFGLRNPSRSVSGAATVETARDLSALGSLSPNDQAMYGVDLTKIVIGLNGYTLYDPTKDSNGDFLDTSLIPDFAGKNADSGLPYSFRPRTPAFES